jgi:RNA 3'-phosphate cyclase
LIHIDGSYGEGGGQIIRYGVALAALTKTPIEITNIRAKRDNPGLRPQHFTTISCIKELCDATTTGVSIGSSHITFEPSNIKSGVYTFDIGTAGSITLINQACILASLKATKPITIKLTGGTDVPWSPSWDYFTHVFLPLLNLMGIKTEARINRRGYYPKGGGETSLTIYPVKELRSLYLDKQPCFHDINGIIHLANLPDHIATRMKHEVQKILVKHNLNSTITLDKAPATSPGAGITLWAKKENVILGTTTLGKKGISSENIAETATVQLLEEIISKATIDNHAIDQILPYFVLTKKPCYGIINQVSNHTQTMIWLIKNYFNITIDIIPNQKNITILVK